MFAGRMSFCWFCRVAAQIVCVRESWSGYVLFLPVTFGGLCGGGGGGVRARGFEQQKDCLVSSK